MGFAAVRILECQDRCLPLIKSCQLAKLALAQPAGPLLLSDGGGCLLGLAPGNVKTDEFKLEGLVAS